VSIEAAAARQFLFQATADTTTGEICPVGNSTRLPYVTGHSTALATSWLAAGTIENIHLDAAVGKAYRAARMSRFEHGESGAPSDDVMSKQAAKLPVRARRRPGPIPMNGGPSPVRAAESVLDAVPAIYDPVDSHLVPAEIPRPVYRRR
jgi:hypothetical protein